MFISTFLPFYLSTCWHLTFHRLTWTYSPPDLLTSWLFFVCACRLLFCMSTLNRKLDLSPRQPSWSFACDLLTWDGGGWCCLQRKRWTWARPYRSPSSPHSRELTGSSTGLNIKLDNGLNQIILFKGTVSRDRYFFKGLNILIRTFCVCADGFQDLSIALHYPVQLLTCFLLLWNYLLILKMLTETLLRISFSVIGRCSLVRPLSGCRENVQELTCNRWLPIWFYSIKSGFLYAFGVPKLAL